MLLAARSTVALHRLLDALPALSGDDRITRLFTLIPGSEFGTDVLSAVEAVGGRLLPWSEALGRSYDLVLAASPKGEPARLPGPRVLLPHGAGFNKAIPSEGSADSASGLDPAFLDPALRDPAFLDPAGDTAPLALYALAHPDQLTRLTAAAPAAARRAKVIGDPTLDRLLASRPLRDRYRAALRTGPRTLIALTSTWGPHSLLGRHPDLPARLAAELPHDEYQLALIVHPNEWSRLGPYELGQRLEPALAAGLVLPHPREEWGAALIAADALVTDHGSTALYYAAVGARPMAAAAGRGCGELIPTSPMGKLLDGIPELIRAEDLVDTLAACRLEPVREAARAAFAHEGDALHRLRGELYELLDLTPRPGRRDAAPLPDPVPAPRAPTAFDVTAETCGQGIRIARHPAGAGPPGHHLAAEHGAATERQLRSAGLLFRRRDRQPSAGPARVTWTADGWARETLDEHPGCRTAAVELSDSAWLLRVRGREHPYVVEVAPLPEGGRRLVRVDPAAAVSAAHVRLVAHGRPPLTTEPVHLTCLIGERTYPVRLRAATDAEARQEL
ncbi:translation initiation factor 2 [Streptomyces sp. NPDC050145]|uniref:translation initiation factor 2 n=1 Tax=Streptomyces sp. NPDC050145 TaxID=3365602 RepID=UPI0037A73885